MGFFNLKKLLLIFFLLLQCGCSVTYELEIKDDLIYEKSKLVISKEIANNVEKNGETLQDEINYTYESFHDVKNGQEDNKTREFTLNKIDDTYNIGLDYVNKYTFSNFKTSPIIKQCYENVDIEYENNIILINTSNHFKCFDYYSYLNDVKIMLKTNYEVINHNSDDKINDTYYWYINKNNYERKEIRISFSEEDSRDFVEVLKEEAKDLDNNDYDNLFKYTFIILGLVSLVIIIFVFIKVKTSNKK